MPSQREGLDRRFRWLVSLWTVDNHLAGYRSSRERSPATNRGVPASAPRRVLRHPVQKSDLSQPLGIGIPPTFALGALFPQEGVDRHSAGLRLDELPGSLQWR